jgi:hypothetical protein
MLQSVMGLNVLFEIIISWLIYSTELPLTYQPPTFIAPRAIPVIVGWFVSTMCKKLISDISKHPN